MVQLRHLRAGNQINAIIGISNQFNAKEFRDAVTLVGRKLGSTLEDPVYREYEAARLRGLPLPAVSEEYHALNEAVRFIGNTYEELGTLLKNGIIDKNLFLDRYAWVISQHWRTLEERIAYVRAAIGNDALLENFEYLVVLSRNWMREHPSAYPKGVPRLQLHNPWPVPPLPASA